jgi:hypothetical protein
MAIRTPLKIDSTNLKDMSSTDTGNIISRMVYLYMTDPSVTLSVVANSGSLDAINDTRMQAGAHSVSAGDSSPGIGAGDYPSEATTAEPSVKTITYDKLNESITTDNAPGDPSNIRFPVYIQDYSPLKFKAMSLTDMYDSFVSLATNGASELIPAAQPYKISDSTTPPSGYTNVSTTPIFIDTRADTSLYTAAGIGETLDQPQTITSYYLHKSNGTSATAPTPMYIDSNQNLKEYTAAELDVVLKEVIRYTSVNLTSNKLRFYIGGAGTTCGTGMANTKLNGAGNYQTRQVGDDYRAQEFPNGSVVTEATYYLKARKE